MAKERSPRLIMAKEQFSPQNCDWLTIFFLRDWLTIVNNSKKKEKGFFFPGLHQKFLFYLHSFKIHTSHVAWPVTPGSSCREKQQSQ